MHVSSSLQQNCHSRALSQSGAERGEEKERERKTGRRRKPETETNTGIEDKKPDRLSHTVIVRKGEAERCEEAESRDLLLECSCT